MRPVLLLFFLMIVTASFFFTQNTMANCYQDKTVTSDIEIVDDIPGELTIRVNGTESEQIWALKDECRDVHVKRVERELYDISVVIRVNGRVKSDVETQIRAFAGQRLLLADRDDLMIFFEIERP